MKVTTDACLFGAWVAAKINNEQLIINNCLDIGTGTGLLSLMLAQKCSAEIDAIEIDDEAAAQATENEEACSFRNRIQVINTDVKNFQFDKKYDAIISNPPFYENELKSVSSKKNIAHHSDNLSLQDLLTIIKQNLNPGGLFFLLLPFKRDEEIRELVYENKMQLKQITLVRQSVNHDFFRIMIMGAISEDGYSEAEFDEISIWDEHRQYTEEFVQLLKDYYLYL
jgi:tRNA1Val (adenine37-N6)-methyltransferase